MWIALFSVNELTYKSDGRKLCLVKTKLKCRLFPSYILKQKIPLSYSFTYGLRAHRMSDMIGKIIPFLLYAEVISASVNTSIFLFLMICEVATTAIGMSLRMDISKHV